MKRRILAAAVFVAFALLLTQYGQAEEKTGVRELMQLKLTSSQKVLAALAVEDFDALMKHSQQLALLSLDASWKVLQTEEYAMYSKDFRRFAHAIRDAGKKKNTEGAALAYVQLTLTCVNCHKYVRSTRTASRADRGEPLLRR